MPTENHPTAITLAARRSQAAAIIAYASELGILTASLVVDLVDIGTAAVLGALGLDHLEIRRTGDNLGRPMTAGERSPRRPGGRAPDRVREATGRHRAGRGEEHVIQEIADRAADEIVDAFLAESEDSGS